MGPQLYRCGNHFVCADLDLQCVRASMGPQLYRCGNLNQQGYNNLKPDIASMGPQLYRCGNIKHQGQLADINYKLQWGRNFIVAEIA